MHKCMHTKCTILWTHAHKQKINKHKKKQTNTLTHTYLHTHTNTHTHTHKHTHTHINTHTHNNYTKSHTQVDEQTERHKIHKMHKETDILTLPHVIKKTQKLRHTQFNTLRWNYIIDSWRIKQPLNSPWKYIQRLSY